MTVYDAVFDFCWNALAGVGLISLIEKMVYWLASARTYKCPTKSCRNTTTNPFTQCDECLEIMSRRPSPPPAPPVAVTPKLPITHKCVIKGCYHKVHTNGMSCSTCLHRIYGSNDD